MGVPNRGGVGYSPQLFLPIWHYISVLPYSAILVIKQSQTLPYATSRVMQPFSVLGNK